jgi:hypothetical protein
MILLRPLPDRRYKLTAHESAADFADVVDLVEHLRTCRLYLVANLGHVHAFEANHPELKPPVFGAERSHYEKKLIEARKAE